MSGQGWFMTLSGAMSLTGMYELVYTHASLKNHHELENFTDRRVIYQRKNDKQKQNINCIYM